MEEERNEYENLQQLAQYLATLFYHGTILCQVMDDDIGTNVPLFVMRIATPQARSQSFFYSLASADCCRMLARVIAIVCVIVAMALSPLALHAQNQSLGLPRVSLDITKADSPKDFSVTLQVVIMMTILTVAPSILMMATCFTRIIVVFHFLKQALGTQTQPPAQVLAGLAMFLTFFVMSPVLNDANTNGLQPYLREEITQSQALDNMVKPFRAFMLKQVRQEDLALFLKLQNAEKPNSPDDISILTLVPAYTLSELRIGFQIGFVILIPFLVIDMIISSILMSLGMMLLPPQLISLPVKILLFILVDGWNLIVSSLMNSILK